MRVLDDTGKDRTPKSLSTLNPAVVRQTRTNFDDGYGSASDSEGYFLDRISAAQFSASGMSQGGSAPKTPASESESVAGRQRLQECARRAAGMGAVLQPLILLACQSNALDDSDP